LLSIYLLATFIAAIVSGIDCAYFQAMERTIN
jgi:hypothetical protein